ncbi:MAG TPA: tetratricopeptide repeat protein [Thermoanaerobaculia bacterium]
MNARRSLTVLLLLLLATAGAGAEKRTELTAIITQVDGAVEADGPGLTGIPRATPWQVIRSGVTVRVPKGGVAGIVCSNRRFVRLRGPASWSLTAKACAAGKELTPAEYTLVAPQGGRFKVVSGLLVLEREMRGGDEGDPLAPVVLSPRNTVLRSPRPTVSWTRVPSATEYEVKWSGRRIAGYDTRLTAGDTACKADSEGLEVCSLPWPADRPDLPPGEIFFLRIVARQGIAESWHGNDPVEARTQAIAEAEALENRFRQLDSLSLGAGALEATRGGLLASEGLYADAAELYRRALALVPGPELLTTLGDIHLAMGLYLLAEPRYRAALADDAPAVRAAAAFGLGRIAYTRGKYQEAADSFQQARNLYSQLTLGEEEEAARQAAQKAAARAPK